MTLERLRLIRRSPLFGFPQIVGEPLFECIVRQTGSLRFGHDEIGQHDAEASAAIADDQSQRSVGHERFLEHGAMRIDLAGRNGGKTPVRETHRRAETVKVDNRSEQRHWGAFCGLFPFR